MTGHQPGQSLDTNPERHTMDMFISVLVILSAITMLTLTLIRHYETKRDLRQAKARAQRILDAAAWRADDPHPVPPLPRRRVSSDRTAR